MAAQTGFAHGEPGCDYGRAPLPCRITGQQPAYPGRELGIVQNEPPGPFQPDQHFQGPVSDDGIGQAWIIQGLEQSRESLDKSRHHKPQRHHRLGPDICHASPVLEQAALPGQPAGPVAAGLARKIAHIEGLPPSQCHRLPGFNTKGAGLAVQ